MKKLAVISDIDGTISDRRHRLRFLEGKKDWKSFFSELHGDPPMLSTINSLKDYHDQGFSIIFVTGRPEEYREETVLWLKKNLPFKEYDLFMRPVKNYEKDVLIKQSILEEIQKNFKVIKVFDDQIELIEMWKKEGLECVNCSLD
jgi:hypothetical protein